MDSFPSHTDADRPAQSQRFSLRLSPQGRLMLAFHGDAPVLDQRIAGPLTEAFAQGSGHGLACLGATSIQGALSPVFVWWRDFAARFMAAL